MPMVTPFYSINESVKPDNQRIYHDNSVSCGPHHTAVGTKDRNKWVPPL